MEQFTYQPLPASDSIRLLILEPGEEFDAELVGSLSSIAFSARPAYVALSYTWLDRDDEHGKISLPPALLQEQRPFIRLRSGDAEGHVRFQIGHNLALALLHLRPRAGTPLPLWIDQVCINQADLTERAAQVALMSFVYRRARLVVCWLGVARWFGIPSSAAYLDYYTFEFVMARHKVVRSDGLGLTLDTAATKVDRHRTPDDPAFYDNDVRLDIDNPYWQRIWIVQEVCLAPVVAFMQGPHLWSEADLATAARKLRVQPGRQLPAAATKWVQRLLEARSGRFGEAMRLETLVERFRECGCRELRDKFFALVGLAIDAEATSMTTASSEGEAEDGDGGYGSGGETEWRGTRARPERGGGAFRIDYERSFFDIWRDAVCFVLWRARPKQDFGKEPHEMEDERRAKIVRFAGVLQDAFEGKVEEDMPSRRERPTNLPTGSEQGEHRGSYVLAKGYIASRILHLGPTYDEFVGLHRKHSEWISSLTLHYSRPGELESLRAMEEQFSIKIINRYADADVARVRAFGRRSRCFAYSPLEPDGEEKGQQLLNTTAARSSSGPERNGPPRRFLGTNLCMGMAPAEAQVGDFIVRFWNCDAAIVVRALDVNFPVAEIDDPQKDQLWTKPPHVYSVVGRADVAEMLDRTLGDSRAKDKMRVYGGAWRDGKYVASNEQSRLSTYAVYVRMDFETLQQVSASIVIHE